MSPIIGMLHNTKTETYHPILFLAHPLGNEPGELGRYRSKVHHTNGFKTRNEAVNFVQNNMTEWCKENFGTPQFVLSKDFAWDGEDEIPAMTVYFIERAGEVQPAF